MKKFTKGRERKVKKKLAEKGLLEEEEE